MRCIRFCYPKNLVCRLLLIVSVIAGGFFSIGMRADTFQLNNGETVTGEVLLASANDSGVQVKTGEGEYRRIPWTSFSQEDLKKFAQNKKVEPLVEPFIEITPEEKAKKTEVNIKQPPRLARVAKQSLLGAMFDSGLGLLILLLMYTANLYAAYEVSIFRAQSMPLVCGVSAVLPLLGPILFLALPTRSIPTAPTWETTQPVAEAGAEAVNPMQGEISAPTGGLKLHSEPQKASAPEVPAPVIFQRGQFTFNRRFFETRFPGFFGVVRRDADKEMVLAIKTSRGHFGGQRITRIAANDLHLEIQKGHASEEVMIPFVEIQEIQLKHKDAP